MSQCEHQYVYFETVKQQGSRASFGMSPAKQWKRIDRFYCEKCLDYKDKIVTAEGWEEKPDWY
jgi:hypothetical protein